MSAVTIGKNGAWFANLAGGIPPAEHSLTH
jgi:hypothetical protein